jgi:hypothetical protein
MLDPMGEVPGVGMAQALASELSVQTASSVQT